MQLRESKKQETLLWRYNIAAGVLHLISFCARLVLGILFEQDAFRARVSTDFFRYSGALDAFSVKLVFSSDYPLFVAILPFTAITAAFHLCIAFIPPLWRYYMRELVQRREAPLRWTEYSITAGFMTWTLAQLVGITNVFVLINLLGANAMMNLCGWLHERLNNSARRPTNTEPVDWLAFYIGFIPFAFIWATLLSYFFAAITSSASRVPWFVWGVYPTILFSFLLFPLNMYGHYSQRVSFLRSVYAYEKCNMWLSMINKQFLAWFIFIGTLTAGY